MYEVRHYLTPDGKDVFLDWLRKLRDVTARIAVDRRVNRIELGNFGDHKFCRDGVWEIRIDVGAGTGCITQSPTRRLFCCCAVATSERRMRISTAPVATGKTGKGEQAMRDRAHDEAMAEMFREDPAYAVQLLNSILEEGDQSELLITLRQMTKAFGGVSTVAETAHLSTTQLYRTLSPDGNPVLSSLSAILKAMGLRLAVQSVRNPHAHA